jgi:hypothetical protein
MAHGDNGGVSFGLDLLIKWFVSFGIDPGFPPDLDLDIGPVFGQPASHLGDQNIAIVKAAVYQIERFAGQVVRSRR